MLEDMLRGYVMEFLGSWDKYIPLMEFAYNNSYQASIGMAPYEVLCGHAMWYHFMCHPTLVPRNT